MIFFKKKRLAKKIKKTVSEIIEDQTLINLCENITSNKEANSLLYDEAVVQKMNFLTHIVWKQYGSKYEWCDTDYLNENFIKGFMNSSRSDEIDPKRYILRVFELQNINPNGRTKLDEYYMNSAELIYSKHPDLGKEKITEFLDVEVQRFLKTVEKYFH